MIGTESHLSVLDDRLLLSNPFCDLFSESVSISSHCCRKNFDVRIQFEPPEEMDLANRSMKLIKVKQKWA